MRQTDIHRITVITSPTYENGNTSKGQICPFMRFREPKATRTAQAQVEEKSTEAGKKEA
jgi:hypothetical protein